MLTKKQRRKVFEADQRYQECVARGIHPIDSGERTLAVLGGETVKMARCLICEVRYPAPVA